MKTFFLGACLAFATVASAQHPDAALPSDVTFNLRRSYLEQLRTGGVNGSTVGARWSIDLRLGERSNVHTLENDCEIHVAAKVPGNRKLANPSAIVIEPPNVCKRRVPQISQTGSIATAWRNYFDDVRDDTCKVTGFPRIFSEHAAGGGTTGSNPDHVLELHPVTGLECNGTAINFVEILRYYPGMRAITPNSASACLDQRRLWVRQRGGTADDPRYEFKEAGAKGSGGRCGNFIIVDAYISKEYLRRLANDDHTALARVWIGDSGPFALKVYTYATTPVNERIAALMQEPDDDASIELKLHGMLTYDYFTIIRSLQRWSESAQDWEWLPRTDLQAWQEVPNPLSLVVFGIVD